jgi:hypothetical protein
MLLISTVYVPLWHIICKFIFISVCSLCIRRFLSRKNKCPVCNEVTKYRKISLDKISYLTLCRFSFEINKVACLIQDVVHLSPHCGDERMVRLWTRRSLPNYFVMTLYHWNVRENTVTWHRWMNGKYKVTSCIKCSLTQCIVQI